MYEQIVTHIFEELESKSPLSDDLMMMFDTGPKRPLNEYMALVYRSEMKKTMKAQVELIKFVQKVLQGSLELFEEMREEGADVEDAKVYFKEIYMEKMPSEIKECEDDGKGDFVDPEALGWYHYRRLYMRNYLQSIYQIELKTFEDYY